MSANAILLFLAGLALVIGGAESLVRGASRLAAALGVPTLIIGLTIVAFGTSSPEAVVSIQATAAGRADIAVGNVIGSNIFNVLFVLGLSSLIAPLRVSEQLIRLDVPVMIGVCSLSVLLAYNGTLSRPEGLLLLGILLVYIGTLIWLSKRRPELVPIAASVRLPEHRSNRLLDGAMVVAGLAGLVVGSRWFVEGAVELARLLGFSELVIGLTIAAGGTSLPEVATAISASLKGERDIVIGAVVGSNIFNVLLVLGSAAAFAVGGITVPRAALSFDMPFMVAAAIACIPVFFAGMRISRLEGGIFLAYYVAYIVYLVIDSTHREVRPALDGIMLLYVVPLTVLTLTVLLVRSRDTGGPETRT